MSGFSPVWLALREPVDHRSRDDALGHRLRRELGAQERVTLVDLGCGSGSNIRATSALLPIAQSWTLVDYDARLLAEARARLCDWADACERIGDGVLLRKGARSLSVHFREVDLNRDLEGALGGTVDLVTASAFFDLCSTAFIEHFAAQVAARQAHFFTVLTYNGVQDWTPAQVADAEMREAFKVHQLTDKGFGAAAGWTAPAALKSAFTRHGYVVEEGDSPWRLGAGDEKLVRDLATGFAGAVSELGTVSEATIEQWLSVERTGAVVGHTDTLALAPGARR